MIFALIILTIAIALKEDIDIASAQTMPAVMLSGDGSNVVINIGESEFNRRFAECPVVIYERNAEVHSIYKRISDVPSGFNAFQMFTGTWRDENNRLNVDFEIFSSEADMMSNTSQWTWCNFNDPNIGYPRDCGPNGSVGGEWFSMQLFHAMGLTDGAGFLFYNECPMDADACRSENYACENYITCCANGGYLVDGRTEVCSRVQTYAKRQTCGELISTTTPEPETPTTTLPETTPELQEVCNGSILLFGSKRYPQDMGVFEYFELSNSGQTAVYLNHISRERLFFDGHSAEWRVTSLSGSGGPRVVGKDNVVSPDHVTTTWRTCCWVNEPSITATCLNDDEPTPQAPQGYADLGAGMCSNSGVEWNENVGTLNALYSLSGIPPLECAQLCTVAGENCLGYSVLASAEACFLHYLSSDSLARRALQAVSRSMVHRYWSSASSLPINSTAVNGTHWGAPLELFRCFNKTDETRSPTSAPTLQSPSSAPTSMLHREESSSQSFYSLMAILAAVIFL